MALTNITPAKSTPIIVEPLEPDEPRTGGIHVIWYWIALVVIVLIGVVYLASSRTSEVTPVAAPSGIPTLRASRTPTASVSATITPKVTITVAPTLYSLPPGLVTPTVTLTPGSTGGVPTPNGK